MKIQAGFSLLLVQLNDVLRTEERKHKHSPED